MKLELSVGLEVNGLGGIPAEKDEGLIETCSVSGPAQGELIKIVGMYLWFVRARAHDPLPILGDSHADTGFFELEVLEQFDSA